MPSSEQFTEKKKQDFLLDELHDLIEAYEQSESSAARDELEKKCDKDDMRNLMEELEDAVLENHSEAIYEITDVIEKLIAIFDKTKLVEWFAGEWWFLTAMLSHASSCKNSSKNVKKIAAVINKLAEKCDATLLEKKLSEKVECSDACITPWYCLAAALQGVSYDNADDSDDSDDSDDADDSDDDADADDSDDNKNDIENFNVIANVIERLAQKCDPTLLMQGLSAQIMLSEQACKNGWDRLLSAFCDAPRGKSKAKMGALIVGIIAHSDNSQISKKQKQVFFKYKSALSNFLGRYLEDTARAMSTEEFEKMCSGQKLLGELIDHQRGFFKTNKTKTRIFVDQLIEVKKKRALCEDKKSSEKVSVTAASAVDQAIESDLGEILNNLNEKQLKKISDALSNKFSKIDKKKTEENIVQQVVKKIVDRLSDKETEEDAVKEIIKMLRIEAGHQLGVAVLKDGDLLDRLTYQVVKHGDIQSVLIKLREKPVASSGYALDFFKQDVKSLVVPSEVEPEEEMVSIHPAKPVESTPSLSENALQYAKIVNRCALELYPHFDGLVNFTSSPIDGLQTVKTVLRPNEMEKVKEKARAEWDKEMAAHSNQKVVSQAPSEIDRLLASVVVSKEKLKESKPERDVVESPQKKRLPS